MFRFFTVGKTIALLLIVVYFLAGAALTSFLVYDRFQSSKADLIENAVGLAESGAQQQLAVYFRDVDVLDELLDQFLKQPSIHYAADN